MEVIFGVCIWSFLHFIIPSYTNRIISIIHSTILSSLSILYLFEYINLELWLKLQFIPISYCLYDLIFFKKPIDKVMFLHHIAFMYFSYFVFPQYPYYVTRGYLAEISTPFLHYSYILIKNHKIESFQFKINVFMLMLAFFVFRVLNFTYLSYLAWNEIGILNFYLSLNKIELCLSWNKIEILPLYLPIILTYLTLINYIWFYRLTKLVLSRY